MNHFNIFFLILNVMIGLLIILRLYQFLQTEKNPVVNNLFIYSIYLNCLIAVDFSYKYCLSNIYQDDFNQIPAIAVILFLGLIFISQCGLVYSFFKVSLALKRKTVGAQSKRIFYVFFSLFFVANLAAVYAYMKAFNWQYLYVVHMIWLLGIDVIIWSALLSLLSQQKKGDPSVKAFIIIFMIGFFGFTISHLDFYFFNLNISDYDPTFLFILNICPLIWLRFYDNHITVCFDQRDDSQYWQMFIRTYRITKREKMIVELIAQGKTNKEIKDILFISINTVKNHIYNIYQKTGVKSRSQLIHLLNQKLQGRKN